MAQQAITLRIAGKKYSLNIASEKEEMYRLAEREVNNYLSLIMEKKFKDWNLQDYLSMAALKFAIADLTLRQDREVNGEDLTRLEEIDTQIDNYLHTLPQTKE